MKRYVSWSFLIVTVVNLRAVIAQHNTDLWIGNGGGRLAWSPAGFRPGSVYHPLSRVNTFIRGWSANNPGFDRATAPFGGVAPLVSPVHVWLEVVSLDPALLVIDNSFNVLEFPGDRAHLGGANLHVHLTWFIDEDDPRFDPEQCVWQGTFRLVDTGSGLAASQPFTLLFSNVPVRGGEFPPTLSLANGDFNGDRIVNAIDFAAFSICMNGPNQRPEPDDPETVACEVDCFNAFDFDDDMDVDLRDAAGIQRSARP